MRAEIVATNDIERARINRDVKHGTLRQRLVIEWRCESYCLHFTDHESVDPDTDWMWRQLKEIVERHIPLVVQE